MCPLRAEDIENQRLTPFRALELQSTLLYSIARLISPQAQRAYSILLLLPHRIIRTNVRTTPAHWPLDYRESGTGSSFIVRQPRGGWRGGNGFLLRRFFGRAEVTIPRVLPTAHRSPRTQSRSRGGATRCATTTTRERCQGHGKVRASSRCYQKWTWTLPLPHPLVSSRHHCQQGNPQPAKPQPARALLPRPERALGTEPARPVR